MVVEPKFTYKKNVRVAKGFYKGYDGVVVAFKETKDRDLSYTVELEVDRKKERKDFNEDELKFHFKFKSPF